MKHILIVDDERGSRESLRAVFENEYEVSCAASAEEAVELLSRARADLVLLDVIMPDRDGIALLDQIQHMYPGLPVVMVSASTTVDPVVKAIKGGAHDFVTKPFDVSTIRRTVLRALENSSLQRQVKVLQGEVSKEYPIDRIIGESPVFRQALGIARNAAESGSCVLITGESGTGKELIARSIHAWSHRRDDPFVAVHCAELSEAGMDNDLFGFEEGAFAGAENGSPGLFDLAASGTLFFNEIGELTPAMQRKLLRVLEEKAFVRAGGTRAIHTGARVLAASSKNLLDAVENGQFSAELAYRLGVVPVQLPALRERRDDIPRLAAHYLNHYRRVMDVETEGLTPETLDIFCRYSWPGNIRELRNVIERMLVLHGKTRMLEPDSLPEELRPVASAPGLPSRGGNLADAVNNFERQLIERALSEAGGIQTRAARALGTTRRILKYRMEKLNIRYEPAAAEASA